MKRIVTVIGARPQFIKASVLTRLFGASDQIHELLLHTGQHFDDSMSGVFFRELDIPEPARNLNISGGTHAKMTADMMVGIEDFLMEVKPHAVLVYGDTNSSLAAALVASKMGIDIFHVEAGLRSFNMSMPEELNRIIVDRLSTLLFAPTQTAVQHLTREGCTKGLFHVGDVMYDSALYAKEKIAKIVPTAVQVSSTRQRILMTIHRASNTDNPDRMTRLVSLIGSLHEKGFNITFPVHPRTKMALQRYGLFEEVGKLCTLCDPLSYFEFQAALMASDLLFTDSGGAQKEAYFHEVPCVTFREETEWVELVHAKWNRLLHPDETEKGLELCLNAINSRGNPIAEYGDGTSGRVIFDKIQELLSEL